jgi:hypothetical protein
MAKRRRRIRTRLGDTPTRHREALPGVLGEIEERVKQAEMYLNNGLCRQAADYWATAENLKGMALVHTKSAHLDDQLNRRKVNTFIELARLRLKVLNTCTRDD